MGIRVEIFFIKKKIFYLAGWIFTTVCIVDKDRALVSHGKWKFCELFSIQCTQYNNIVDKLLNWLFVLFGAAVIPVITVMTTNQIKDQTLTNRFILSDSRRKCDSKTEIGAITVRQLLQTKRKAAPGKRGVGGGGLLSDVSSGRLHPEV